MMDWIRTDKELPPMDTPVLAVSKIGKNPIVTASMRVDTGDGWLWAQLNLRADTGDGWLWAQLNLPYIPDLNDPDMYEVDDDFQYTHWMPMPQPPQQEEV